MSAPEPIEETSLADGGTPMSTAVLVGVLPTLLEAEWGLAGPRLRPSDGPAGMASFVVEVDLPEAGGAVAKWVPSAAGDALDVGSAIALEVEDAGVPAGAPLPTRSGALSAVCLGGRVALLHRVPGRPLTGSAAPEQRWMADVLARLHTVRPTVRRRDPYLAASIREARDVEPWVRPSVEAVLDEYAALPALAWGLVHHDPAPEAFFHDNETGSTAMIDWTGAGEGPVLFDVASAVMYLGGRGRARVFLDTYAGLVPTERADEVRVHLAALLRFRGAVQAAYFSVRVAQRDLTGVSGQADNLAGLEHARRMLVDGGVVSAAGAGATP